MQNSGFQVQHKCGYHSGEKMNSVPISEGLKKKKKMFVVKILFHLYGNYFPKIIDVCYFHVIYFGDQYSLCISEVRFVVCNLC